MLPFNSEMANVLTLKVQDCFKMRLELMSIKPIVILCCAIISILGSSYSVMAESTWMTEWTLHDGTKHSINATLQEFNNQNGEMMQVIGYFENGDVCLENIPMTAKHLRAFSL